MSKITNGDVGKEAAVRGISLEGHRFEGYGEVQGVRSDMFGDIVEVKVNGQVQHFRQNNVARVREDSAPSGVTGGQPGGCAVIPMLLVAAGAVGAKYGVGT
jgi:hypothetical protein